MITSNSELKLTGTELIAKERERQISEENWTPEHDDKHTEGELTKAAICYAMRKRDRLFAVDGPGFKIRVAPEWPWEPEWWKPTPDNRVRELVKAGALIAAEIDRLKRQESANGKSKS